MGNQRAKFKRGDILYCHRTSYGRCECVVQVLSRKAGELDPPSGPGYHVRGLSSHACIAIHDDCCAENAVKVSSAFAKYLHLFDADIGGWKP